MNIDLSIFYNVCFGCSKEPSQTVILSTRNICFDREIRFFYYGPEISVTSMNVQLVSGLMHLIFFYTISPEPLQCEENSKGSGETA